MNITYPIVLEAATTTNNTQVEGIDVSSYQRLIDYDRLAQTHIGFMFMRGALETVQDRFLIDNVSGCKKIGMPYGIYYAVLPNYDWKKQAERHASLENEYGGKLPPVLDIERTGGLTQTNLTVWIANWINLFEKLTKREVIIYTSWGFFNYNVTASKFFANRLLWLADYTPPPNTPISWAKYGETWTIWQDGYITNPQYYGIPKDGAKKLDHNYFYGNSGDFYSTFGVYPKQAGEPGEPGDGGEENQIPAYVITTTAMNPRGGPGVSYPDLGTIVGNSRLRIVGEEKNGYYPAEIWLAKQYLKRG